MALNKNSLVYSCLDKLIEMTKKRQSPCETNLQWLSSTWSTIDKMPLLYRSYCYHKLSKIVLDLQVALSIKSSQIWVFYYRNCYDGTVYINLDREYFDIVLKNKAQKNHLANGVTQLITSRVYLIVPSGIPFKEFLSNCESIKIVKTDDCLYGRSYGHLHTDTEFLLDCFTVCPNIEIFENFNVSCRKVFCKYILGGNYDEMKKKDIKKILNNNKPSWLKLKSISRVMQGDNNTDLDDYVNNLCFIILKDFQNSSGPFSTLGENEISSQRRLTPLLETSRGEEFIPAMRDKFQTILIDHYRYYFITGLQKRKVMVDVNLGNKDLKKYLKIFKKLYCKVHENQVNFCLSDFIEPLTLSNQNYFKDHLDLIRNKYSFILKFALICTFSCRINIQLNKLRLLTELVSQAPNLQILNISFDKQFNINKSLLPVCLSSLPCLGIDIGNSYYYDQYIERCIKMFPNVENLILNFQYCYTQKIIVDESNFGFIQDMKNLKSFYVKFDFDVVKRWFDLLVFISGKIDKNVKLFFSLPQFYVSTYELSHLRNIGWHVYIM